jgi:hypothetical protein
MKLQSLAAVHPVQVQALAGQASADGSSAQTGQASSREAALREALPSRQAGDGSGRAARTATSVLRSISNSSQGSSAHASSRMQTVVVRQSDDVQTQDDSTDDSIALPNELDVAIAVWANAAVENASDDSDEGAQVRERPTHRRITRDGGRQQQRGQQQQPHQQPQKQDKEESPTRVAERRDGKQAAQASNDGLVDETQASDQRPPAGPAGGSPWTLHQGARSTARVAAVASTAPARRQLRRQVAETETEIETEIETESILTSHESSSDTVAALMWALAAMVVAIIATLLLTVFSDSALETDPDTGRHEAPHHEERRDR